MSVRITARPERGIRRVGVHHPAVAVVYPDGYFGPREIEILKGDADLIVELLDDEHLVASSTELRHLQLVGQIPRAAEAEGTAAVSDVVVPDLVESTDSTDSEDAEDLEDREDLEDADVALVGDSGEAHPDVGDAPASVPSNGLSAELNAAEGDGDAGLTERARPRGGKPSKPKKA